MSLLAFYIFFILTKCANETLPESTVIDIHGKRKVDDRGKANTKAKTGEEGSPSPQESTGLEPLSKRAMAIAALSDINGSVSNFYLKYLLQLIIPLTALVVVIIVMTYIASKHDSGTIIY